jgi:hypothetical protein
VERVNQTVKRWLAKKVFETGSVRWIDCLVEMVCAYNRTVHRATSKSPFMLFFGHPGFDSPLEGGEVVNTVNGFQIVEADEIRDLPESERDNAWSFEIDNEIISDNEQGFDNFGNLDPRKIFSLLRE